MKVLLSENGATCLSHYTLSLLSDKLVWERFPRKSGRFRVTNVGNGVENREGYVTNRLGSGLGLVLSFIVGSCRSDKVLCAYREDREARCRKEP